MRFTSRYTATAGVAKVDKCVDTGALYASKDFYDPVKNRRINWGWARVPPASTQVRAYLANHISLLLCGVHTGNGVPSTTLSFYHAVVSHTSSVKYWKCC